MINTSLIALGMLLASNGEIVVVLDEVPTVQVSIAGLDLTKDADRLGVERRIRWAARRVCGVIYLPATTFDERNACKRASLADATAQLARAMERRASRDGPLVASIAVAAPAR